MSTTTERGDLSPTLLLDASVIDDPYAFYRRLVTEAPVWRVPDSDIVIVSSYAAVSEVVSRVDDFSSNLHAILCRSALGTPALVPFEAGGLKTLAVADPPVHTAHRRTVFPELVARRMPSTTGPTTWCSIASFPGTIWRSGTGSISASARRSLASRRTSSSPGLLRQPSSSRAIPIARLCGSRASWCAASAPCPLVVKAKGGMA